MRIAVTGSTGLVGTALTGLWDRNHEVTRVIRGPAAQPSSLWDPASGWIRPGALEGVDAVIHLAGASIGSGRWSETRKEEIVASRVAATKLLAGHLAGLQRKPAVFVSASAVGFYGSRGDEALTEESARGSGFLADLCVDWERESRAVEEAGIRTVILRLGVVMAKEGGALGRMLLPFKLGAGGRIGSGKQWMPWVSLADVAGAFDFAVRTPALSGTFNLAGPQPATNAEFTKALASALHRPAIFPIPPIAMKLLLGGEAAQELILASQRVLPNALTSAGFAFQHADIGSGVRAALGKARN